MFKAHLAQFLLFGWLSCLIAALPITKPTSISLSSEDIALQLNATHLNPLNASQIIRYSIPQTQIAILIYTGNPISGSAMRDTLEACLTAVHATMSKHGDVYMFPDPYVFKSPPALYTGLQLRAYSTLVPGLKWLDLATMLLGVEQAMWQRGLYKQAHIKMYDEPSGSEMGVADLYKGTGIHLLDIGGLEGK